MDLTVTERLALLAEAFGKVAHEVADIVLANCKRNATGDATWGQAIAASKVRLRKELVETAAVCMEWVRYLDTPKTP